MTAIAYLSLAELRKLTGKARPRAQALWLRRNRWRFAVSGAGEVLVSVEYWHMRLGADVREPAANDEAAPDFTSLTPAA